MKNQNDKLFYLQYKRCFNCQIDFETELKIKGLWSDYEKHIINSDIDGVIHEFNIWIDEADACMKQWTKRLNTIKSFGDLINKFVLISATKCINNKKSFTRKLLPYKRF